AALVAGGVGVLAARGAPATTAGGNAEGAARAYIQALVDGDETTIRRLTPSKLANRFGPCPFVGMPKLHSPRVDAHRAGVLFTGKTRDDEVPDEGGLRLVLLDDVKERPWRVRQIFYFTELPMGAKIPSRSVTEKDEAQEPVVLQAARSYIAAWQKGDYEGMNDLAFDWLARDFDSYPGIKIRSVSFTQTPAQSGEIKLKFTAKLRVMWVLPKTVEGTVFAMREDGQWRIRGNELTL
ncbi:MAG: hypothetical protein JSV65_13040, partial [Armatimonadota bacterium]